MKIGLLPFYIALYDQCAPQHSQPARDFAKRIEAFVDGYYIITPFSRTSLVSRIISGIH